MRPLAALFALLLTLPARAEFINLDPEGLKALLAKGVPLVDVRTAPEWRQTGVVKGSHLLTFFDERGTYDVNAWMAEFGKIAGPGDEVILICRSGNRTGRIGAFLDRQVGYKKVYHLQGGIKRWMGAGNETIAPQPSANAVGLAAPSQ